jgi:hypothetical protein
VLNVPHIYDIAAALVSLAGNGLTFWLVKRLVDDRVTGVHEQLSEEFRQLSEEISENFQSHITQAKDQLAGMDRKVCHVCKRMHTQTEATPQGPICAGCKVRQ